MRASIELGYGYIRPRRVRAMRGYAQALGVGKIKRPWLRYAVVQAYRVTLPTGTRPGPWSFVVVGTAWTKRTADRVVRALQRLDAERER